MTEQPSPRPRDAAQDAERVRVVAVLAESSASLAMLERAGEGIRRDLVARVDPDCHWQLKFEREAVPLDDEGRIRLTRYAGALRRRHQADLIVYVSDLPRLRDGRPVMADINPAHAAALVSGPSLGRVFRRRARQTVVQAVARMTNGSDDLERRAAAPVSPMVRMASSEDGANVIGLSRVRGHLRLLGGMVLTNRPWRLAPALSSASAAAAATGAFGIFYSSIWSMADALSAPRLLMISVLSIGVMTTWLVGYNGLWERRDRRRESLLYNGAAVATVGIAVTVVYLILYAMILVGALAVISSDYLAGELGHPANVTHYLTLAWLSTSMGIVAGALGSSWDQEEEVRRATFGRREYERRQQTSDWEDEVDDADDDEARTSASGTAES